MCVCVTTAAIKEADCEAVTVGDFLFTELPAPGWTELQMFPRHSADSGVLRSVSSSLLLVSEGSPAIAESDSVCSSSDHVSVGMQCTERNHGLSGESVLSVCSVSSTLTDDWAQSSHVIRV